MKPVLRICAIAMMVMALVGCNTGESDFSRIINERMPVSPAMSSSFGVIGILPADSSSDFQLAQPTTVNEAMTTISIGSFLALMDYSLKSDRNHPKRQLEDVALSAALASAIGIIGGLIAGVPEMDIKRAQAALSQALQDKPLEPGIQAQLLELVAKKQSRNFKAIPGPIALHLDAKMITKKSLRKLASTGIDSVLLLQGLDERFVAKDGMNPPLAVEITLKILVVRVSDGRKLFENTPEYHGEKQQFTRWGANNAKLFRAELDAAQWTFAGVIFDELSNPNAEANLKR